MTMNNSRSLEAPLLLLLGLNLGPLQAAKIGLIKVKPELIDCHYVILEEMKTDI
jgi:hypothetical protein